ncbi:carbohydrate ABC transporter permease [Fusicatenibacter saccharivorans]|uniref:carbohydrate ABC transporter permease n=1 Tax=Fusicatenibacter saccharivorans TaxID=1150298 RepID=UPI003A85BDBF
MMSTIATTIAGPKTYSAEELQALHLAMNAKAKRKKMLQKTALVTMNLIVCLFMLFPLLYTISVAFMPSGELYTMAMNIVPKHPTLENFVEAFHKIPLGQIVTCSLAAFAFSFLNFKGKNVLFMLVMATMMVPGEATIISNYLTVGSLGLLDTYIVLILPSLTSAMGIFLFRQFYMTFPISLYESAKLDGCGNLRFIVKILMPLTKSAMGAMAVYTFINAWNMYMWPLLVTGSDSKRTVQIGISMLNSVDAQSITLMLAGVVMIIIPSISIFIVGQKALIKGMFSGAVKG